MNLDALLENLLHPPVMFFFLGLIAMLIKSDLEIPPQIAKFLGLYLLFDIGIKGGEELFHSGFSWEILKVLGVCVVLSAGVPFLVYQILKLKLDAYNAGAIAAAYGSISAVTFATGLSFLENKEEPFGGFMVAGMVLMESPAVIAGLFLIRQNTKEDGVDELNSEHAGGVAGVLKEAFFNGSVLLLIGSMVIGYLGGAQGQEELKPFVNDIFKGMLSLYMLDMGIVAGKRMGDLRESGFFLIGFALLYPIFGASLGLGVSYLMDLSVGNSLLMTILTASASYIAVPAAMRMTVPQANMGLLLPMTLGITFSVNIILGIPVYYWIIMQFWH